MTIADAKVLDETQRSTVPVLGRASGHYCVAGRCLLTLGKADQAAALLEEGIALLDESFVRDLQIT
jgi:hypothetical protein